MFVYWYLVCNVDITRIVNELRDHRGYYQGVTNGNIRAVACIVIPWSASIIPVVNYQQTDRILISIVYISILYCPPSSLSTSCGVDDNPTNEMFICIVSHIYNSAIIRSIVWIGLQIQCRVARVVASWYSRRISHCGTIVTISVPYGHI